jgi:hypothetical protein
VVDYRNVTVDVGVDLLNTLDVSGIGSLSVVNRVGLMMLLLPVTGRRASTSINAVSAPNGAL